MDYWQPFWLSIKLATVTTVVLLIVGIPLAHWLNSSRWKGTILIETLISMPIVLPPTVIGFYLLVLFSPQNPLGHFWQQMTGYTLAFSFTGLVIGSAIYSLPFAVQPFQSALKAVPTELVDIAKTSGATWSQILWHVRLPIARRGIGVGVTLTFAHTIGEFGVVLMLGGNIPGTTRVASIALYDEVQKLNYPAAHVIAGVLLAISFVTILVMTILQRIAPDTE